LKNLILTYKTEKISRGAFFIAKRLAEKYDNLLDYIEHDQIDYNIDYRDKYNKLIFNYQQPNVYSKSILNFRSLYKYQDIVFIRDEYSNSLYNSFSNGFYYWKNSKSIKSYIPILTFDNKFINNKKDFNNIKIGIYVSIAYTEEYSYYSNFIRDNSDINFLILGDNIYNYSNVSNTYDNEFFFNEITHYLYIPSIRSPTPFPNTLLEAVLSNVNIIILGLKYRKVQDGVLDIVENINYLDEFNLDKITDNKNTILNPDNLDKFYKNNLLDFEGFKDKTKFKTFNDLLLSII
jgi:hypothetical protein